MASARIPSMGSLSRYVRPTSIEKSSRLRRISIELWESTVSSMPGCRSWMALVSSAAIGGAAGMTPSERRPMRVPLVLRSLVISCCREITKLRNTKGTLIGRLSLGVIPAAPPMAALLTKAIHERHPGIELTVLSQSSIEILRNLEDFSIDVGLTYLDNEPIEGMRAEAIYMERYCLLVRADNEVARKKSVTWAEAAQQPLCLLTPNMQNRRIIDRAFRTAGTKPNPRLETNSVINLYSNVHLINPAIEHSVGLVAVDRDPVSPLVLAVFEAAKSIDAPAVSKR